MKILILTQWFDPEPTFKGLLFARELAARGHEVEVLTGFPNYPGGKYVTKCCLYRLPYSAGLSGASAAQNELASLQPHL